MSTAQRAQQDGNVVVNFVAGRTAATTSGRGAPLFNPATGEESGWVGFSSSEDVAGAVAAAKAAYPAWAETPPAKRANYLFKFKALLDEHRGGDRPPNQRRAWQDPRGRVGRGRSRHRGGGFRLRHPHLLKGDFSRNVGPNIDTYSDREPLGVVAGITPFNFPAMVPLWMYPVAIACGNTFILKPSERDPSAPMFVAGLLHEAGLPRGVLNVVHGDKEAVDAILLHPDIKAVSFVGSTPVAEHVYTTGSKAGKRVQALGGAKNHVLVLPDADIDQAADALMGAAYGSAGERCMAVSVAVPVGEETADRLVAALARRASSLRIGPASDPEADMGPVITEQHRKRGTSYIEKALPKARRSWSMAAAPAARQKGIFPRRRRCSITSART